MKTLDGRAIKPNPPVRDQERKQMAEEVGPGGCLGADCCESCNQGRHCNNGHSCRFNERPAYNPFTSQR